MTLIERCAKRRTDLPILPCDCAQCVWYIRDISYNDCFWVLSAVLNLRPGLKFSFEEIAAMENVPVKDIVTLFDSALKKLREQAAEDLGDIAEEL